MIDPMSGAGLYGDFNRGYQPNPFFTLSNQFLPRNFKELLRWADFIVTQSPTAMEVLRKHATYPITDFIPDTDSQDLADRYKRLCKAIQLKHKLNNFGLEYYTRGNSFVSVYLPFVRTAVCPSCKTVHNVRSIAKIRFRNGKFTGGCPARGCGYTGVYEVTDKYVRDEGRINLISWDPNYMTVNHNPVTGESEYYYQIPPFIKRKVLMGDTMYLSTLPMGMLEAIGLKKSFKFDPNSIYHLMNMSIGKLDDGVCIPPIMAVYQLIFHQAMMRRANEAIASEHMTPLRVIFPQPQSSNSDPVMSMSLAGFVDNMKENIKRFKHDPNHQVIAPVPVGISTIGGDGKNLLVAQELQLSEEQLLMSLGVSREMMAGTTNWTSSTIGLRMLKNSMENYVRSIDGLIDWVFNKISAFLGIARVPVKMTPFELTDDEMLKQFLPTLAQNGQVSDITLLESIGLDFREEQERQIRAAEMRAETAIRIQDVQIKAVYKAAVAEKDSRNRDERYEEAKRKAYDLFVQLQSYAPQDQQTAIMRLQYEDMPVAALLHALMTTARPDVSALQPAPAQDAGNPGDPNAQADGGQANAAA